MQPEHIIQVRSTDDHLVDCLICHETIEDRNIAAMTRTKPGGAFDAWCHECFAVVVGRAAKTYLLQELVG